MMAINYNTVATFFRAFGIKDDQTIFIRTFAEKGSVTASKTKPNKYILSPYPNHTDGFPDGWEGVETDQEAGWGVHFALNSFRQRLKRENVAQWRAFVIDFDDVADWEDRIKAFPLPPSCVVSRGDPLRAHVYWFFSEFVERSLFDWESYQRALAKYFGCARSTDVSNASALIRLPGSLHQKNGVKSELKIVGGTMVREAPRHLIEALKSIIPAKFFIATKKDKVTIENGIAVVVDPTNLDRFASYLNANPAPADDGVKNALYKMACKAKEQGIKELEALPYLLEWAVASGRYSEITADIKAELVQTVENAYLYSQNAFGSAIANSGSALHALTPADVYDKLDKSAQGGVRNTLMNAELIISSHPILKDLYGYNELTRRVHIIKDTQDIYYRPANMTTIDDIDYITFRSYCSDRFRVDFSQHNVTDAILKQSFKHCYHPVRDYLNSLTWDGEHRVNTWLFDYCNAEANDDDEQDIEFIRWAGASFLVAAVARVHEPGVKYDHMLVLEGQESIGKSTVFSTLAGSPDFFLATEFSAHANKDYYEGLDEAWIVEIAELTNLMRVDQDSLKHFISQQASRYRKSFRREGGKIPRQYVLAGTTNKDEYLMAADGNRRFMPVRVNYIDLVKLHRDRDQLWAEALVMYKAGFSLAMPHEIRSAAKERTSSKEISDPWAAQVIRFCLAHHKKYGIDGPESQIRIDQVYTALDGLNGSLDRLDRLKSVRIANILKQLGYHRWKLWVKEKHTAEVVYITTERKEILEKNREAKVLKKNGLL